MLFTVKGIVKPYLVTHFSLEGKNCLFKGKDLKKTEENDEAPITQNLARQTPSAKAFWESERFS